ncbi:MAG: hypothetical protein KG075_17515 [Alphaproteobacteria bacterium]|nr:hypothetical protein [Alphaproteobacteria bacterium]
MNIVIDAAAGDVMPPEGLPLAAVLIWEDYARLAQAMGTLKPCDAVAFGQWCVMTANIQATWKVVKGQPPPEPAPASYIQQWRTLGELFGVMGEKSRVTLKAGWKNPAENPFGRNGKR